MVIKKKILLLDVKLIKFSINFAVFFMIILRITWQDLHIIIKTLLKFNFKFNHIVQNVNVLQNFRVAIMLNNLMN